jgi:MFS family permease
MSNWISGYMENALHLDKALGDILGMAMFAILLGIARISYARFGKNIIRVLMLGMVGAAICYLTVGLTSNTILAFVACIFTGLFTSMLWPGTLIMMEEKIPGVGVAAYALMASGGDLGASVAPQLMGIVIDRVTVSNYAARRALETGLTPEQIGMQTGMLVTSLFPIAGMILLLFIVRYFKKKRG